MARIELTLAGGSIGDIEAVLTSAGFGASEAREIARRILNSTHSEFRTARFRRLGIDIAVLLAGLRTAGLRVQYTGVEPSVSPPAPTSDPGVTP